MPAPGIPDNISCGICSLRHAEPNNYAVLPSERRKCYATAAVNGLSNYLLQNYSIPHVMLDISMDNKDSESVAQKCGFEVPYPRAGYMDEQHPEVVMRFRWFKRLTGQQPFNRKGTALATQ